MHLIHVIISALLTGFSPSSVILLPFSDFKKIVQTLPIVFYVFYVDYTFVFLLLFVITKSSVLFECVV
jgi:hypothetical protein